MYTLAGLDDREQGWGIRGETYAVAEQLAVYGEETWFRLGDRDLAAHIVRTARLRLGDPADRGRPRPPAIARGRRPRSCRCPTSRSGPWSGPTTAGSSSRTTSSIATRRRRSSRSGSTGSTGARPTAEVADALAAARAVLVAPSNPIVSIGPILAVPGLREASPAARGRGVRSSRSRGSSAAEPSRGRPIGCSPRSATRRAPSASPACSPASSTASCSTGSMRTSRRRSATLGLRTLVTDTVMTDDAARARVAAEMLAFAGGSGAGLTRDARAPGPRLRSRTG